MRVVMKFGGALMDGAEQIGNSANLVAERVKKGDEVIVVVSAMANVTDDLVVMGDEDAEIILRAAKAVGGGVLGVDAMEREGGIVIHEVNSTVEFKGAMSVSEVDIPGRIIEYALNLIKR